MIARGEKMKILIRTGKDLIAKKNAIFIALLIFSLNALLLLAHPQTGQEEAGGLKESAPRIFIECETCDLAFIQSRITFVNHVETRSDAQVYVFITVKKMEDGGEEYTLSFKGQKEFEGDDDILKYRAEKKATPDEVQQGLAHMLKMALMRYAGKTPVSSRISVNFMDQVKPTDVVDKWNFWVFSISANSFLNGEKNYKSGMYYGSLSANRVTPKWKMRFSVSAMSYKDKITYEDEVYESASESQSFRGLVVKSLNEHWSIGGYFSALSSTYSNIKLSLSPAPAIEYNFFPYSESTRRQLRLLYRLNFHSVGYREETIYLKTYENLWQQALSVTLELKQKWGTISTSLEGSHYFHDFNKNRLEFWSDLSLRLFKGLNFNIYGSYSKIHDQLSLPRSGASLEDILLLRRQLETTYSYYFSVGLSYTFGSTQSKVVNPRFGDGGGGISMSISM